jgi:beta-N-acetylhexosaminidase
LANAFVTGLAGPILGDDERNFIRDADPFGVILFRRNIEDPAQVSRLTSEVRAAAGRDLPVLVDQEGGRVQRLTAPHWRRYPSAARLARACAACGDDTLLADVARLMAEDLRAVGITVDCMPCLDLGLPQTSPAIGDRAYGGDVTTVTRSGRAAMAGMLAGGVLPVMKHIPGHGRATVDSHHDLPVVTATVDDLAATDFAPFVALSDAPAAMTAHLVYMAIDPDWPATQSSLVIHGIIRGLIGFDGLLFSDDLSMNALVGPLGERAGRAIAAGCDIALHCNGVMAEMEGVAAAVPALAGEPLRRAEAALSRIGPPDSLDSEAVVARLEAALTGFDVASGI